MRAVRRSSSVAVVVLAAGCLGVRYGSDGAGAGGAGAEGAGGTVAGGAGSGGEAAGPCVPVAEVCNGLDDDCDGVADEPDSGDGAACGCSWRTWDGRLYAVCESGGDFESAFCPAGTDLAVVGSPEEQAALFTLLPGDDVAAFIGLRQEHDASHPAVGWRWVSRDGVVRDGPSPAWYEGQPNDRGYLGESEPVSLENGDEDCGYLVRTPAGIEMLTDGPCAPPNPPRMLCEQQPGDCVDGAACRRELGCPGTLDCSLPEGDRCVPAPQPELCNGFDDDCDGELDDLVCGCSGFTDPSTGRAYELCTVEVLVADAACAPGYRLAAPQTEDELTFLASSLASFEGNHVGVVQALGQPDVEDGWALLDGTPVPASWWASGEPNDGNVDPSPILETDAQNCARLTPLGLRDCSCTSEVRGFLCEAIP
jgi:hypothetical protein